MPDHLNTSLNRQLTRFTIFGFRPNVDPGDLITLFFSFLLITFALNGNFAQQPPLPKVTSETNTAFEIDSIKREKGNSFVCGSSNISDVDGNVYQTVLIGGQCWLTENLKTTHYRNSEPIEYPGENIKAWLNNSDGAFAWHNNDSSLKESYGALYNWRAVANENGLCPGGWHVPDTTEWNQLFDFVIAQGYPNQTEAANGTANALKSCRQENSPLGGDCNTTDHPRWNSHPIHHGFDEFNFSALPAGSRSIIGAFSNLGLDANWWTSTSQGTTLAWAASLNYNFGFAFTGISDKPIGFSVRCVKD